MHDPTKTYRLCGVEDTTRNHREDEAADVTAHGGAEIPPAGARFGFAGRRRRAAQRRSGVARELHVAVGAVREARRA